jgi:ribose transport system substrate-binding protein
MAKALNIAVILKGSTSQIWKWIQAGATQAVRDLQGRGISVDLQWKSPLRQDDSEEQAKIFENYLRQSVDGVVLAPCDDRTLVTCVEGAAGSGIPTVVIDSALDTTKIVSFIATDNKKGGALAAKRLAELLHNGGKVLLLRHKKGAANTEAREQGFAEKMRSCPGFEVIASEEYAGGTRDSAKRAAEVELRRYGSDLKGIFTPNESSTAGMVMAILGCQLAGKIAHVGFDTSDIYLDSLRRKQILGLVVQNPFLMGKLAVETIVDHLSGKTVPKRIDTGVTMVTPDNIDAPEIKLLVSPPFAR